MARKRFRTLVKRLRRDPKLHMKFREAIEGYLESGYAKRLAQEETSRKSKTWYLPMHPVFNVNKPNKIRIVNDAGAICDGVSLNSSLVTGPDLLNSLIGVLMNFRTGSGVGCRYQGDVSSSKGKRRRFGSVAFFMD